MKKARIFNARRQLLRPRGRRAFTFIEILFAIIILGVGMIMIAGMLPVAIKQNSDTRNDLTARVVADGGYAYLRTLAQSQPQAFPETHGENTIGTGKSITAKANSALDEYMSDDLMGLNSADEYTDGGSFPTNQPVTSTDGRRRAGRVVPLSFDVARPDTSNNYRFGRMSAADLAAYPLAYHQNQFGDRVVSGEPRFQWLGFYRRDEDSDTVKLIVVAMRQQNSEVTDRYGVTTTMQHEELNAKNGPFLVPVEIEDSLAEPDKVKFVFTGANPHDLNVAETGSYLIIAHSPPLNGNANGSGDLYRPFRNNGRVFKLAARRDDLDAQATGARVWELAPGFDLGPAGEGADGILGTADDVPDGSMNTAQSFAENCRAEQVHHARRSSVRVEGGHAVHGARDQLINGGRVAPSTCVSE